MGNRKPVIEHWRIRTAHHGGKEFWKPGPNGLPVSVSQPHGPGNCWRIYWGTTAVIRNQDDLGIFDEALDAICVAEVMLADEMKNVIIDW
jgi:hypothetical protein